MRALLGILAFIPFAGIVANVILFPDRSIVHMGAGGAIEPNWPTLIGLVVIAFVQMAIAIPFIVHIFKNERLSQGKRIAWAMGVVFVGSFADPCYWGLHVMSARETAGPATS